MIQEQHSWSHDSTSNESLGPPESLIPSQPSDPLVAPKPLGVGGFITPPSDKSLLFNSTCLYLEVEKDFGPIHFVSGHNNYRVLRKSIPRKCLNINIINTKPRNHPGIQREVHSFVSGPHCSAVPPTAEILDQSNGYRIDANGQAERNVKP